ATTASASGTAPHPRSAATTASASGTAPHPRSAATPAPHAPAPDPAAPRRSGPDDASDHTASRRPAPAERLFVSEAVEAEIARVKAVLKVEKLAWMFENCFPNTLDTTVHYRTDEEGADDTFVYTGDIHAMWLRDSGAQVWPYVRYASQDEALRRMIAGVVRRQVRCLLTDPYANAFNDGPTGTGWQDDWTEMKPELHERKWELDSPCYVIRLAYEYWKTTGDASVFDGHWCEAMRLVLATLRDQQRRDDRGAYRFQRVTEAAGDTQLNNGYGHPVRPVGLIASAFRPSDDATTFPFLIPSNFFAVTSLRKAAEILRTVNREEELARGCEALAAEVEEALRRHAVHEHPEFGPIYAFEIDGFGNRLFMDDANVPSLLSMAYLGDVAADDPVYRNTRRFVWSDANPYFFRGAAIEGIGGPHVGFDMVWPMSIMMKAFTSDDDAEIRACIETLVNTDAGTGFMHESIHRDDAAHFTRPWFAWQNSLFGELILKLVDEGKTDLLNSIEVRQ
ncbi:glycoside hydrolase family 125 protein, partial [uncultured Alistipes sp.]